MFNYVPSGWRWHLAIIYTDISRMICLQTNPSGFLLPVILFFTLLHFFWHYRLLKRVMSLRKIFKIWSFVFGHLCWINLFYISFVVFQEYSINTKVQKCRYSLSCFLKVQLPPLENHTENHSLHHSDLIWYSNVIDEGNRHVWVSFSKAFIATLPNASLGRMFLMLLSLVLKPHLSSNIDPSMNIENVGWINKERLYSIISTMFYLD